MACDTGGTFTDCLALDPDGRRRRAKVLSTGTVRGRVTAVPDRYTLTVEGAFLDLAPTSGFFAGARLRPLPDGPWQRVAEFEPASREPRGGEQPAAYLTLANAAEGFVEGAAFELTGDDEAPILAARLLTGTAFGAELPPLDLRLATTRGTNALLERKGAPVALFITAGFGDLLVIGTQQRPDLFALDIRRPEPLYAAVVEVDERLAADGSVVRPLTVEALRESATELLVRGVRSAAVAFMHSWRRGCHEEHAERFLRQLGFHHVARSSALSPRLGFLERAQTAVAEAYLGPVIRRYLDGVAIPLTAGSSLRVLTSAGGLTGIERFRAVDSLLSGPAGGVVGAAGAGRRSGSAAVLSFDMGGTSTDVARIHGEPELSARVQVGDARLLVPAVTVETVAAGGGSICSFDGHRLKVGPESAGAHPGPACYGAGGPLTLTDVNLLLGRLGTEAFQIPLDPAAAQHELGAVLRDLEGDASTGGTDGQDAVLAGFLQIANERMAAAMATISVARGYDPRRHALVAFGGAGGQHACAVATLLGVQRVLIPRDAALLSAVGLAAARAEHIAEEQVLELLGVAVEEGKNAWLRRITRLEDQARSGLAAEGVVLEEIEIVRREAALRQLGQESTLSVPWPSGDGDEELIAHLRQAFRSAYAAQYGYRPEAVELEVESLRVVAASRGVEQEDPASVLREAVATPSLRRPVYFDGARLPVSIYRREELRPGESFEGPSLVIERHSTTVVERGWTGRVDGVGALCLHREGI